MFLEFAKFGCFTFGGGWSIIAQMRQLYVEKQKVITDEELLDLTKPITIEVNGKMLFQGMLKPQLKHLVQSCATFFDSRRLYPVAVELSL